LGSIQNLYLTLTWKIPNSLDVGIVVGLSITIYCPNTTPGPCSTPPFSLSFALILLVLLLPSILSHMALLLLLPVLDTLSSYIYTTIKC
jgi:hypothetical protein